MTQPYADGRNREQSLAGALRGLWDMGAGALRGATTSVAGAPGDILSIAEMLRGKKLSVNPFPTSARLSEVLPPTGNASDTAETLGGYVNIENLGTKAAGGKTFAALAAAGENPAQLAAFPAILGFLRRKNPDLPPAQLEALARQEQTARRMGGGLRSDLPLTQQSSLEGLANHEGGLVRELYSPSMAIGRSQPVWFEAEGGTPAVTFLARPERFDPATQGTSLNAIDNWTPRYDKFIGRRADAYLGALGDTPTGWDTGEYRREVLGNLAVRRLADRFLPAFQRGGFGAESGAYNPLEYMRMDQIREILAGKQRMPEAPSIPSDMSSRLQSGIDRFQSFDHFQNSPRGADRLVTPSDWNEDSWKYTQQTAVATDKLEQMGGPQEVLTRAAAGDREARDLIQALRTTPSQYAELKAWGPVGIHGDNFQGAMMYRGNYDNPRRLTRQLEERNIPVAPIDDPRDPYELAHAMEWLRSGGQNKYYAPGAAPREPDPSDNLPKLLDLLNPGTGKKAPPLPDLNLDMDDVGMAPVDDVFTPTQSTALINKFSANLDLDKVKQLDDHQLDKLEQALNFWSEGGVKELKPHQINNANVLLDLYLGKLEAAAKLKQE